MSLYNDRQQKYCYHRHNTRQRPACNRKGDRGRNWNTVNYSLPYFNQTFVQVKSGCVVGTTRIDSVQKQPHFKIAQEDLKLFRRKKNFLNRINAIDETRIWNFKQSKSHNNVWKSQN